MSTQLLTSFRGGDAGTCMSQPHTFFVFHNELPVVTKTTHLVMSLIHHMPILLQTPISSQQTTSGGAGPTQTLVYTGFAPSETSATPCGYD